MFPKRLSFYCLWCCLPGLVLSLLLHVTFPPGHLHLHVLQPAQSKPSHSSCISLSTHLDAEALAICNTQLDTMCMTQLDTGPLATTCNTQLDTMCMTQLDTGPLATTCNTQLDTMCMTQLDTGPLATTCNTQLDTMCMTQLDTGPLLRFSYHM